MPFSKETRQQGLQKARESLAARAADQKARTVLLGDGTRVYPDIKPGVGWVLAWKSRKAYYRSRDEAIAMWPSKRPPGRGPAPVRNVAFDPNGALLRRIGR